MSKLVYINPIGTWVGGVNEYEFLFSEDSDEVWADDWTVLPIANSNDTEPLQEYISECRLLKTDIVLIPAQDNSCFSYQDCKDGVYAVGYQDITMLEEYPEYRLVFNYGEEMESVCNKLYKVGLYFE